MPPPRGTPHILLGPGDYDVTTKVHSDTYPAIDPSTQDFSGKCVFISGGSKGIGRVMALSFAKAGASRIAVGARSDLTQLGKDIAAAAGEAGHSKTPEFLPLRLDVTDRQSVEAAAKVIEDKFGHCDVVVNNAGILGTFKLLADSDPDEWRRTFDVNFFGQYLIIRSFIPLLLRSSNTSRYLVNVSSVAAHLLNPTGSAYELSKTGVTRLSQLVDAEYGPQGIICFSVHPGNTPTDIMGGPEGLNEAQKIAFTETPEIGAHSVVFLTGERRDWLKGRYINCTWDMPELVGMQQRIVDKDLFKVRLAF
ncbi:Uncharacterized protein TCAP_03997 [Tolypocladium capitatum]|uniref:Uncharacterized protein n=1 Tax=Tolypocladium capitatum TaxID=45235 RepID=A0A2K3QEV3_9HYPO|nr:Uncharacterized protein TCAP_03997 [Tolypocladium capitatum]